jgi:hypothetical protein
MADEMFVPVGFPAQSVIVSHVEGVRASFDRVVGNGFYVRFETGYRQGDVSKFQYMVS